MATAVMQRGRQVSTSEPGIRELVEIVFRRKMIFILPIILGTIVAVAASSFLPRIYRAQTLVFIQSPVLTNPMERGVDYEKRIQDRMRTIREEIKSYRFLSEIIDEIPTLSLSLNNEVEREAYVNRMRASVNVHVRGSDLFEISYQDPEPRLAQDISNRITSKYIEDILTRYSSQYNQALNTLQKEQERLLASLQVKERQMTTFRELNKDFLMPEVSIKQQIYNQESQLRDLNNQLDAANRGLGVLKEKLAETPRNIESERTIERDPKYEMIQRELRTLELDRDRLMLRFTDKHPEVKGIEEQIELRQRQLEDLKDEIKTNVVESINPLYQRLQEQMTEQEIRVKNLVGQIESAQSNLNNLRQREARVPQVEEEYRNLIRDYDSHKQAYDSVLVKIRSLETERTLEDAGQQIKFEIRDSARLPTSPIKPNVPMITLAGMGIGVALGFILVFGLEYFDHSIRTVEQARSTLSIPILGAIPIIVTEEELRRELRRRTRWMMGLLVLGALLLIAFGIFAYRYWDQIIVRLGL